MKQKIIPALLVIMLAFSSCAVQKQQFGNYENQPGKTVVHEKGKEIYLFWDQVLLQDLESGLETKDYEKIKKRKLFDSIITYGTMGIVSYYTVTIKVKNTQE